MTTALILKGAAVAFAAFGGFAGLGKLTLKYRPQAIRGAVGFALRNRLVRLYLTGHEQEVMDTAHLAVDILQQGIDAAQAEDAAASVPTPPPAPPAA